MSIATEHKDLIEVLIAAGHTLKTTQDGNVDMEAWNFEYCEGPACTVCCGAWCVWCYDKGQKIEPCSPLFYEPETSK